MEKVFIKDSYIKLGQAMKLSGQVSSGVEAKFLIGEGEVSVNGEVCTQRGKKLVPGDEFTFNGETYLIENS
ncbi:MAG: RNA-binding S4 domain-containing protein [Eubacterium sp.]|nr:RNA-binding S4 domain-containing protein [Eubacterium sp.]